MYNQSKISKGYTTQYLMKKTCDVTQGQSLAFFIMPDPQFSFKFLTYPVNSPFWITPRRWAGSHHPNNHHLDTQHLCLGSSFSLEVTFYFLLVFLKQNQHMWIRKRRSGQEIKLFATIKLKVLIKIKIKIYIKNMIYASIDP